MADLETIKDLRESTGAGLGDINKALAEAGGDKDKALKILRAMGKMVAQKKSSRTAKEGIVEAYVHTNKKLGVLLELRCETDFVARNEEFKKLAHELAMQIAAANPKYLRVEDVPQETVEEEKKIYSQQVDKDKPEKIREEILKGKLQKRWAELCLLEQPYMRDPDVAVKELITQAIAKLGENIEVGQFIRFEI